MGLNTTFTALWNAYPDYISFPDSAVVKQKIGGQVTEAWLGPNACTIRLSRAFNYTSLPIPANHRGLATVKGADGRHYAYRVAEMRPYLTFKYGKPDYHISKKRGQAFDKTPISLIKGVISFEIHFSDASGHFDLWDGSKFSHEAATAGDYWTNATNISIWKTR